eukprot:scaffold66761_cov36-Phaeocystis_antarctica.AAC.1
MRAPTRRARASILGGTRNNNTDNLAAGTSPETVRHLPCTPATELGRLGAFNAGGRLELLRTS